MVRALKLSRIALSICSLGSPIATKVADGSLDPLAQAEPVLQAMPAISSAMTSAWRLMPGKAMQVVVGKRGEDGPMTINERQWVAWSSAATTYGPTPTHRRSLEIAVQEFGALKSRLDALVNTELPRLEKALRDAGAPWIEGQKIPD